MNTWAQSTPDSQVIRVVPIPPPAGTGLGEAMIVAVFAALADADSWALSPAGSRFWQPSSKHAVSNEATIDFRVVDRISEMGKRRARRARARFHASRVTGRLSAHPKA